eukprot:8029666-Alexandrium_andersonii.AAC.1
MLPRNAAQRRTALSWPHEDPTTTYSVVRPGPQGSSTSRPPDINFLPSEVRGQFFDRRSKH